MDQILATILSVFIGAVIGTYFTRQNQHHKWLLDRRAESFELFLKLLAEGRSKAVDIKYNKVLPERERKNAEIKAYIPAMDHARIVKLYLPKEERDKFYDFAHQYVIVHTMPEIKFDLTKMQKIEKQIQDIFARELSSFFWLYPVIRMLNSLFGNRKQL